MGPRVYTIVVLGSGGVGKSCLTAQFVNNIWIESYDPTIEDSYRKQLEVDGRQVVLEILDTAGTEQFTALRELYIKTGHGFLLVFSITSSSSLNELHTIREQILRIKDQSIESSTTEGHGSHYSGTPHHHHNHSNSSNSNSNSSNNSSSTAAAAAAIAAALNVPLVLVGNKSDLEEDRAVTRSRAFAVSQSWGRIPYYESSARRRANVDEVFKDLVRQIIRREMTMGPAAVDARDDALNSNNNSNNNNNNKSGRRRRKADEERHDDAQRRARGTSGPGIGSGSGRKKKLGWRERRNGSEPSCTAM